MEVLKISTHCPINKRNELLRVCRTVAEQTCHEPGCQSSLFSNSSDNGKMIILEQQWQLWADLSTYLGSDHFKALIGAMKLLGKNYEIHINGISHEVPGDQTGINQNEK